MRPAHSGITPEGWPCIGLTALSALVFAFLDWGFPAVVLLAACCFSAHFFRDPERVVPQGEGLAVSRPTGGSSALSSARTPLTPRTARRGSASAFS